MGMRTLEFPAEIPADIGAFQTWQVNSGSTSDSRTSSSHLSPLIKVPWCTCILALLAWEALARDPLARLRRIQVESTGTTSNFRPAAITDCEMAASALLIASRLALTAAVDAF